MTPEDAFWHATTNTPIDGQAPAPRVRIPDIVSHYFDAHHNEYIYVFEDGAVVKLYQDDVVNLDRRRSVAEVELRSLVQQRYLEARGDKL